MIIRAHLLDYLSIYSYTNVFIYLAMYYVFI